MQRWRIAVVLAALCCGACGSPRVAATDPELEPPSADEIAAEYRGAARAAYARGVYLDARGDAVGALHEYGQAVRLLPQDERIRAAYAQRLVDAGRIGDAAAFLRGAAERFGLSADERMLLAQIDFLSGRFADAARGVDAALAADAQRIDAWELRGRLELQADRPQTALDALDRAASLGDGVPADIDVLRAECHARLGHADEAERLLRRSLDTEPQRLDARRQLAELLRSSGRSDEALQLLRGARQADPGDPDAIEATLEAHIEANDLAGAAALLEPYFAAGVLAPRLAYLYGRVLMQLDRPAAADSVLRPLTQLEGVAGVEPLLGDIAVRLGRPAEAVEHYRKAMQQRPQDCAPAASLALLGLQMHRRGGADSVLAAASVGRPEIDAALHAAAAGAGAEDYRCQLLLGLAYSAARRFADALPHLEATLRLDPESSDATFNLAMAHQELGHFDDALELGRELLAREPENAAAMNFVGYALAERGRELPESERLVRAALVRDPDNGYYVDSLGWVLYQKGDYAAAATELERAVDLTRERDALILEHLGDAYVRIGRLADAHRVYLRSRALDPERTPLVEKITRVESQLRRR